MKITHDKKADAVYITLGSKAAYDISKKITENILVDYAVDGTIVGIEVLDASKNMSLPPNQDQIPIETI